MFFNNSEIHYLTGGKYFALEQKMICLSKQYR